MASTCIQCRRYILDAEPRSERTVTKTVVIGARTLPVDHTVYEHQDCPK